MIIRMRAEASPQATDDVVALLAGRGYETHVIRQGGATAIGVNGRPVEADLAPAIALVLGVETVVSPAKPYRLAARSSRPEGSVVRVGSIEIGRGTPVMMAGPCAVESREQTLRTAECVARAGAVVLRGGAYKPRSSPYSFQGLGEEGLEILAEARARTGLPVVTEVMEPEQVELVAGYADMLQIGSRNMMNVPLLRRAALSGKPILLKRGFAATIEEWLLAAEYILAAGNDQVVLCERGVRGFDTATRFTLDLNAVPLLRELTHLPVVVDPSHGTGNRTLVPAMSLAAVAAGAHGLLLEVHEAPDEALCDGPQSITAETLAEIIARTRAIHALLDAAPSCVA